MADQPEVTLPVTLRATGMLCAARGAEGGVPRSESELLTRTHGGRARVSGETCGGRPATCRAGRRGEAHGASGSRPRAANVAGHLFLPGPFPALTVRPAPTLGAASSGAAAPPRGPRGQAEGR